MKTRCIITSRSYNGDETYFRGKDIPCARLAPGRGDLAADRGVAEVQRHLHADADGVGAGAEDAVVCDTIGHKSLSRFVFHIVAHFPGTWQEFWLARRDKYDKISLIYPRRRGA